MDVVQRDRQTAGGGFHSNLRSDGRNRPMYVGYLQAHNSLTARASAPVVSCFADREKCRTSAAQRVPESYSFQQIIDHVVVQH